MEVDHIPYGKTGYFSPLICDYLDQCEALVPYYNRFPSLENFKAQIQEKTTNYPFHYREKLANVLIGQYENIRITEQTEQHLLSLKEEGTFTITTGHQLNLFTGPLYFVYKIITTLNLCEALQKAYPRYSFVPVYWMASEDHDFEEINYFNFQGKKLQWNRAAGGAVGRMDTKGLEEVFEVLSVKLGGSQNAVVLKELFEKAYLEHATLAEATRYLVNELFGAYGLVIVDGDSAELKQLLVPYMEKDIFDQLPYTTVSQTIEQLKTVSPAYKVQVNPRKINYFYVGDGYRERLVETENGYGVHGTDKAFTKEELRSCMAEHPERFSPNVIARPLYQEVILPNLCYIGGGGELAYWLELKAYFGAMGVPFPMLLLRNSALVIDQKEAKKMAKLNLEVGDLFMGQHSLINKKIRQVSNIDIDFSPQKAHLQEQFEHLYELAQQTDPSFMGAVKAQEVKQKKGLERLEKRLLAAQKRKLKDQVVRVTELQNQLFPNYSLQERQLNFSEMYLDYGADFIPQLMKVLKPLEAHFLVLRY